MRKLVTLITAIICAGASYAQIRHTDVVPPRVINGANSSNKIDSVILHLAHPLGTAIGKDSAFVIWHFDADAPYSKDVGADCRGMNVEVLNLASSPLPFQTAAIDSGIMIDAGAGTWERPNYIRLAIQNAPDNWDSQTDKYLGVRFKRGAAWHYGWVKMSIDNVPSKAELKGYAYQQTANTGIAAGAKGIPSGIVRFESLNADISIKDNLLQVKGIEGKYNLAITNITGKIVRSAVAVGFYEVDMSDLSRGLYVLHIERNGQALSYKINLQ